MHDNHSHMNCKWPPRAIVRQCVTQRCLWQVHSVPWACSEVLEQTVHGPHVRACTVLLGGSEHCHEELQSRHKHCSVSVT